MLGRFNFERALGAIDLSDERARLQDLETRATDVATAIARGEQRRDEIGAELRRIAFGDDDGRDAAQALLADGNVAVLAPGPNALREEQETLRAGLQALRRERDDLRRAMDGVRHEVAQKMSGVAMPMIEALESQAILAARELASAYAGIHAIAASTRSTRALDLADSLRPAIRDLNIRSKMVDREIPVPSDLTAALDRCPARDIAKTSAIATVVLS